jgi:hypothetical protein
LREESLRVRLRQEGTRYRPLKDKRASGKFERRRLRREVTVGRVKTDGPSCLQRAALSVVIGLASVQSSLGTVFDPNGTKSRLARIKRKVGRIGTHRHLAFASVLRRAGQDDALDVAYLHIALARRCMAAPAYRAVAAFFEVEVRQVELSFRGDCCQWRRWRGLALAERRDEQDKGGTALANAARAPMFWRAPVALYNCLFGANVNHAYLAYHF